MALGGLWSKLTGGIFGVGIGIAVADAFEPLIEPAKQQAWKNNPNKVLALGELASLVAQALVDIQQAGDEAARTGYSADKLLAVVQGMLTAPGVPELMELWRRGNIDDTQFEHGLRKAQLEPQWDAAIEGTKDVLLTPEQLAIMTQRGIVPDDGLLPVGPPTGVGVVPPMPMIDVDPIVEAGKSGYTAERLAGLARIIGLPASPDLAARMVFRQIIERVDFDRAVSEGNTRNEWAPFLFEGFREILTAHDYAELQLRGYLTPAQRLANTDKHGMSHADSDLLYDLLGRSIPVHQITTGLARGGVFGGDTSQIPDEYLQSLERGNLRPEYYSLAYANRYSYPSAFVLRAITQAGEIDGQQALDALLAIGWPPNLAQTVATAWTSKVTTATDKHLTSAQTGLFTALRKSYVNDKTDQPTAAADLTALGVADTDQQRIFDLWDRERELIRKDLTASAIRKAFTLGTFTQAEAVARLQAQGIDAADAATYLSEA